MRTRRKHVCFEHAYPGGLSLSLPGSIPQPMPHPCIGYLGYPFQYMCAVDELYANLCLFIHSTSNDFHIALSPPLLERISQVASTSQHNWSYVFLPLVRCRRGSSRHGRRAGSDWWNRKKLSGS